MADVKVENYAPQSSTHSFSIMWQSTRVNKAAGYTYLGSGNGTSKDTTGVATNDLWGGNANPLLDTYPSALDSVNAWHLSQGPTTIKASMSVAQSGTFSPGEKITQAVSGAEGEFLGLDFDGVSTGHAVLLPRVGTFDATHVITGTISGATFTPSAVDSYVMQLVIFKAANTTQGSIYTQRVSVGSESASQFSTLLSAAGCTATVAPGGGGTANALPSTGTEVNCGTQTGTPAHSNWFQGSSGFGKAQIVCVNTVPGTGVSADGTFWIVVGDTSNAVGTGIEMMGYHRCDDSEPADLDPFAFQKHTSIALSNANARIDASGTTLWTNSFMFTPINSTSQNMDWKGWRRRGFPSADAFNAYCACLLGTTAGFVLNDNVASPETIACSYSTKRLREKIWLVSQDTTKKHRKGSLRWLWAAQGNVAYDTLDVKLKLCIGIGLSGTANTSFFLGPIDGSTVPSQT